MHISEGVLPASTLVAGGVAAVVAVSAGLHRLKKEQMAKAGLVTGLFFIASLISFPVGAVSVHLVLNGLVGILLGLASAVAVMIALLLQWVLFGFGGFTTLGVNCVTLSAGALAGALLYALSRRAPDRLRPVMLFLTGAVPVLTSAAVLAFFLHISGKELLTASRLAFSVYLPVAAIEGVVTFGIITFIRKVSPAMLEGGQ